jgi:hypothetical protein
MCCRFFDVGGVRLQSGSARPRHCAGKFADGIPVGDGALQDKGGFR